MRKYIPIIILLVLSAFNVRMAEGLARKALVAPDCMINNLINVAKVASGVTNMDYLLDENLNNYATFSGVAGVDVAVGPVVRIKDLKNVYPAGTTAGFCIQAGGNSSILSLDVLKGIGIMLYKGGVLQETILVKEGQNTSALSLHLIQLPGQQEAVSYLTVTSTKDFDEVGLINTGVGVAALGELKIRYAFVGDAVEKTLTTNNSIAGLSVTGSTVGATNTSRLINADLTDFSVVGSPVGSTYVELSWTSDYPAGTEVGFKYKDTGILNINLLATTTLTLTDSKGNTSTTTFEPSVLGLGVLSQGVVQVSVIAGQAFNKARLTFASVLSTNVKSVYYGYIYEPLKVTHHHNFGLTVNTTICADQTTYQLTGNSDITKWEVVSQPTGENVAVSSTGKVTNITAGVTGDYVFRATASDGDSGLVTITKGIQTTVSSGCNQPVTDVSLSTKINESSGSLISLSNINHKENIIDASMSTYAEYTGGLSFVDNLQIIGVKKNSGTFSDGTSKRVGFVVETSSTLLSANLLQFFQIRVYNNQTKTYEKVIDNSNVISAGVIGSDGSLKVRYSIIVPADKSFNEITLWKSGVLSTDLSTLRIYGAFVEPASLDCYDNPIGCSTTMISTDKTGASINYAYTGINALASVGGTILNLANLIDNDPTTYTSISGIGVASSVSIAVKVGGVLNATHNIGLIIDKATYLAGVSVGSWMTLSTYYKGTATGEVLTNWSVLGLDAIGYGDKEYLTMRPHAQFDEIRITVNGAVNLLNNMKLYGLFFRNDIDGDGIPDCIDEISCPNDQTDLVNVNISPICQSSSITVTGKGIMGNSYTLSCTPLGINGASYSITASDGTFSWVIGPISVAGQFNLIVQDKKGKIVSNPFFEVHPLNTTWKVSPENSNWNNWNNWTNGSPWTCTNVTIPSDCNIYPVLTSVEQNGCNNIYFESGGEVTNTHLLIYQKAWVDLTLTPERYYMLSAPLKSMVTGDMFIPVAGNPSPFTSLNASNTPQNRFNPRIYQRLWASDAKGQTLNNGQVTVTPTETQWTQPFNALAQVYEKGKGFSLKAEQGSASLPLTFRFPKEHTEYEYVNTSNQGTGIKETITRSSIGRFIYENSTQGVSFPISVTLTNKQAGTYFLAGNMFMSHLDISEFMNQNPTVKSVQVYDGNSNNSNINANGQLLNNGAGYTRIAPMQSFFISVASAATSQTIKYTESMLVSAPGPDNKLKSADSSIQEDPSALYLTATTSQAVSNALLRFNPASDNKYVAGEDAELLIDNEIRPAIAIFSVANGKALDIQQLQNATEIQLGFYLRIPAEVSLSVRKALGGEWTGWSLFDVEKNKRYSLDNPDIKIDLGTLSTNIGRFYLTNGTVTANESDISTENKVYCYREGTNQVIIRSTAVVMTRCEIYTVKGQLIDSVSYPADEYQLRLSPGINLIKVYIQDETPQILKLSNY